MPGPLKLPENYRSMPDVELLELKLAMEARINDIKEQLSRARERQENSGESIEPGWMSRTEKSRRLYGHDVQRIQLELKRRNDSKKERGASLGDHFIKVARRRLDSDFFAEIMNEAREECYAV
jgi:hypothetical protein